MAEPNQQSYDRMDASQAHRSVAFVDRSLGELRSEIGHMSQGGY